MLLEPCTHVCSGSSVVPLWAESSVLEKVRQYPNKLFTLIEQMNLVFVLQMLSSSLPACLHISAS